MGVYDVLLSLCDHGDATYTWRILTIEYNRETAMHVHVIHTGCRQNVQLCQPHSGCPGWTQKFQENDNLYSFLNYLLHSAILQGSFKLNLVVIFRHLRDTSKRKRHESEPADHDKDRRLTKFNPT